MDACAGVGGNAIQFALAGCNVIAIELSAARCSMIYHNASVYGVEDRIDVICGDFLRIGPSIQADVVFFSPPWGGPEYAKEDRFDVELMGGYTELALSKLLDISCRHMGSTGSIVWLPRNTCQEQLESILSPLNIPCRMEMANLNGVKKGCTLYLGSIADIKSTITTKNE